MKLLVFAHQPPPHHGQSYMVQLLLAKLRAEQSASPTAPAGAREPGSIEHFHVDCRLSGTIDAIGKPSGRKVGLLLGYCAQAIRLRLRHGVKHFYYVPAPGQRPAVYRDWLVMALCRPFFPHLIYHWHAVGLGDWIEQQANPLERWISRLLLGRPSLSIVLGEFNRRDARQLCSRSVVVVPNGIPDPCPGFVQEVEPRRRARSALRRRLLAGEIPSPRELTDGGTAPEVFRVLFIGLCFREKGLFDALEAVALANSVEPRSPVTFRLTIAGSFWLEAEHREFEQRIRLPDLQRNGQPLVDYRGFVAGPAKQELFRDSDCLCFPTYYQAESFGLVVVEAMAHGLPVVTTNWRTVPELLPPGGSTLVEPRSPAQIATVLVALADQAYDPSLRARFLARYTAEKFGEDTCRALRSLCP